MYEQMNNTTEETHCYVGIATCGCTVAVVADDPNDKQYTAKAIAKYVREGLMVERVLLEDFRNGKFGHTCGKTRTAPPTLFGAHP